MMTAEPKPNILALTQIAGAARILNRGNVDLGDEKAVMRALQKAGMGVGDILAIMDRAVNRARALRQET